MGRYPSLADWNYQPVSQELVQFQNCMCSVLAVAAPPPTQSPPDTTRSPPPSSIVSIGKQVRIRSTESPAPSPILTIADE